MRSQRLLLEGRSFAYWVVRRLFELLVLFGRSERAKEMEILVLRHELQVLRRTNEVPGLTIRVPTYQGVDLEKHKSLRSRGYAPMTWIFGVDFKHEETRLRFVFWAARHHPRSQDPQGEMTDDPVILVSMEEEPDVQRERPFYQALDDLGEGMITLREIIVGERALMRRRLNPVSREDEWDFDISAGQIARDFYTEVLQKLFLL